jgi:outer membrane protein TolC
MPRDSARILALGSRWEVAEALAEYQIAEGEVRLAVADQRPDLQLGPGLFFDHGVTRFLVNFALPFLPGGNQGRIAEAEVRRQAAAVHLETVQEMVLADVDQSSARCTIAVADRDSALRLVQAASDHERAVAGAFDRGEIGRLEVAQAVLEDSRANRALAEFMSRVAEARAALERASGVWYTHPDATWPDVTIEPRRTGSKEPP